ncbi:MAG: hypothetical protein KTR24_18330 [Saprospiraceae bacterium]|nr:hypothetical protein [Saprospiraceae bacterium]
MKTFIKSYWGARWRSTLGRRSITAFQRNTLEDLLRSAKANVPVQKDRIRDTRFDALADIEPIDKAQLLLHPARSVNHAVLRKLNANALEFDQFCETYREQENKWFRDFALPTESHGTSGTKGLFFRTKPEFELRDAIKFAREGGRFPLREHLRPGRLRYAVILLDDPWVGSRQNVDVAKGRFSRHAEIRTIRFDNDFDRLAQELNEFDPHYLMTYPTHLDIFAKMQLQGALQIAPRVVRSGADLLTTSTRDQIKCAWPHARIVDYYAASESAPMAVSCDQGNLHLFEDCVVLEPMNHDGTPSDATSFSSHILVTSLTRSFQPIIRYRIDDSVRVGFKSCSCNSPFPVLELVGRSFLNYPIQLDDGSQGVISSLELMKLMMTMANVRHYQIRGIAKNKFVLSIFVDAFSGDVLSFKQKHHQEIEQAVVGFRREKSCEKSVAFDINYRALDTTIAKRRAFTIEYNPE